MRILPLLTALLVSAFLYFLIIDRDTLLALARGESPSEATTATETADAGQQNEAPSDATVGVIAIHSQAKVIDSAVILRGQTEAARQVSRLCEIGPEGRLPISVHESPQGPLRIVVQMRTTDSLGMVWGVTERGETIKVFPRTMADSAE